MAAVHEHHLKNGMTVMCCHQNHLHSLEFGLYFHGGSIYEDETTQGIAHLMEHLCFRSLGGLDADGLNCELDKMGTAMDGATYPEGIAFRLRTHPRFFDRVLSLFERFFANIPWTQSQIDAEKQVVFRQIEQDDCDFEEEISRAWRETSAGAFPLMGTVENVAALSAETIAQWQQKVFQPQNACLCLTGNFSDAMEDTVVQTFQEYANLTDKAPFEQSAPFAFCMRDAESDIVLEEEGGQAKVHIAFDLNEEVVYPLVCEVLSAITGEDNDSLLFQTLREEKALVAEIDSCIEELGEFHRLVIRYDVRQSHLEESLRLVFELLHRLTIYVKPSRLDETRMQFTDNRVFYQDDVTGMNDLMGWSCLSGDTSRCDLDARAMMYNDLTEETLLNAAQVIFRPENMTIALQYDPAQCPADVRARLEELRGKL